MSVRPKTAARKAGLADSAIETGSRVTLHFSLRLADGTVADSTLGDSPLTLIVGGGDMFEALERCLLGLRAGERRRYDISPQEGFGPVEPDRVQRLPHNSFPADMIPEPGQVIAFEAPNGTQVAGVVVGVDPAGVEVDFNHPLAGHDLVFEVEILDVQDDG